MRFTIVPHGQQPLTYMQNVLENVSMANYLNEIILGENLN